MRRTDHRGIQLKHTQRAPYPVDASPLGLRLAGDGALDLDPLDDGLERRRGRARRELRGEGDREECRGSLGRDGEEVGHGVKEVRRWLLRSLEGPAFLERRVQVEVRSMRGCCLTGLSSTLLR